jgi:hypothetical protein
MRATNAERSAERDGRWTDVIGSRGRAQKERFNMSARVWLAKRLTLMVL